MKFSGTAHVYGRDVDTDVIIPARYLNTSDPAELAKHCMEDLDAGFVAKVHAGDILVADFNPSTKTGLMQVKRFGSNGALKATYGAAGGRPVSYSKRRRPSSTRVALAASRPVRRSRRASADRPSLECTGVVRRLPRVVVHPSLGSPGGQHCSGLH